MPPSLQGVRVGLSILSPARAFCIFKAMKSYEQKFYKSKAWRQVRDAFFTKHNGLCEVCGAAADEVHHIIPLNAQNINDPEIAFGEKNLMCLCRACHFEIHEKRAMIQRTRGNARASFDENGHPLPTHRNVIVWGAPASGKSTFVREHMHRGDIVVDLDALTECMTGRSAKRESVRDVLPVMLSVREQIFRLLERGTADYLTAWIVATLPKKREREQLAKRLNAELIHVSTGFSECCARAMGDDERKDKEKAREIINNFFDNVEY